MKQILSILLAGILAGSCNNPAQQNQPDVYYDVKGFVQQQIDALSRAKPLVKKEVQVEGSTQQQTTRTINWSRELEMFLQADINKPAFRTSYRITRPDSLTYIYTLQSDEKLTVRSLTVRLDSASRQPRQIEALLATRNPLYHSERRLLMENGWGNGRPWQLKQYRVSGFQQLTMFDRNNFYVQGTVQ